LSAATLLVENNDFYRQEQLRYLQSRMYIYQEANQGHREDKMFL